MLCDTVAERLRRVIRNHLGLSRVGSSPASVGFLHCAYRVQPCHFVISKYGLA